MNNPRFVVEGIHYPHECLCEDGDFCRYMIRDTLSGTMFSDDESGSPLSYPPEEKSRAKEQARGLNLLWEIFG